ncbi:PP2C family protein-serine/threonine phosphatase [Kangiella koreensis]|uniref:Protein serine/threonine phosphatase n=1 Tax=Kangiella koreensis (strain DSM 16069 / JCM 12317 / KCTC 12182 / SW-125) TaxID=523791 RepID=C7R6K3_KANKD|nr:PP2C family serine/threonine-protein phosphatase [Kangiella koreensis]ACV27431.1 protein serine/threonine phosphatase [Kangiella koreensis DSM 16069]
MSSLQTSKIQFAMLSHKGMSRQNNDDKVFASAELGLWLLSDGVGGLKQGEQASQYAVEEISKSISKGFNLHNAVHSAHSVIKAYNRHEQEDRGATVVAVQSNGSEYEIAWVGDSRAYLWSQETGDLTQLTEDHTLVQKLVNAGLLEQTEVKNHPKRHVITQCLGIENENQLNIGSLKREWDYGESLLLASDGLYEELSRQEIVAALKLPRDNQAKVEYLVELACKNGGSDNISLMLISSPVTEPKPKKQETPLEKFITKIKTILKIG